MTVVSELKMAPKTKKINIDEAGIFAALMSRGGSILDNENLEGLRDAVDPQYRRNEGLYSYARLVGQMLRDRTLYRFMHTMPSNYKTSSLLVLPGLDAEYYRQQADNWTAEAENQRQYILTALVKLEDTVREYRELVELGTVTASSGPVKSIASASQYAHLVSRRDQFLHWASAYQSMLDRGLSVAD